MSAGERLVVEPRARRRAVLELIGSAQRRLKIATFRFSDDEAGAALTAAVRRGVQVEVLGPRRLHGLEKRGVTARQYEGPAASYHAKFMVADGEQAAICTFSLTRRGLDRTCDFLLETADRTMAGALEQVFDADAAGADPLRFLTLPELLVLGPEWARAQLWEWLSRARRSIRLLDPRVSDPGLLRLLSRKKSEGVEVDWLAGAPRLGLAPHGRLTILDDEMVVAGSCSLEPSALDSRREIAVCSRDPQTVQTALHFWRRLTGLEAGGKGNTKVRRAA